MGTINQEVQQIKYNAGELLQQGVSKISSFFEGIVGGLSSRVDGLFSGDVVGINTGEIPNMINAIETYCTDLDSHLETMKANATTDEAFKGEYASAVTDFVGAVKECCYAVVSQLRAFEKTLEEVQTKYTDRDTSMASDIRTQSDELKSMYQAYDNGDK